MILMILKIAPQLCALTNGRTDTARVATWEDFGKFDIEQIGNKYKKQAPLTYFITESMAGPRSKNGKVIV